MMTNQYNLRPFKTKPRFVERVWGKTDLSPWYGETATAGNIGEVWLTGGENVISGGDEDGRTLGDLSQQCDGTLSRPGEDGQFPLLVKVLFAAEKLSVQVHPDNEEALSLGQARGKTECWYVLGTSPGAKVACGLRKGKGVADLQAAVAAGTLEDLLEWIPVTVGQMIFVDAGTVHAIGGGVTLLEVQQASDTTYRLYDYGRDRELHLEEGLKVVKAKTDAGPVESVAGDEFTRLIEKKEFVIDRFDLTGGKVIEMAMDGVGCVVGLRGNGAVNEVRFGIGEAVIIPQGSVTVSSAEGVSFARCLVPTAE